MKVRIVWVEMWEYDEDANKKPVTGRREIEFEDPNDYEYRYEKFVLIPLEED